jgi:hypothetical protein
MDHCQNDVDIDYTLSMAEAGTALDSIMIDCSHAVSRCVDGQDSH